MDNEVRSCSVTPPSGNCTDCGAPLEGDGEGGGGEGGGGGIGDQGFDALHQQPVWISKDPQIDSSFLPWSEERRLSEANRSANTSSRSKSLDRTFCVRTTASPSPRRVVRHKTPPPFQLQKASSAASPAAPRWEGISVWIPNTDLPRNKKRPQRRGIELDSYSDAASSLQKSSSFRSRGSRSGTTELPSPGLTPSWPWSSDGSRRVSSSCDSCVTHGHLQASKGDRRTGFSIFGRDAPGLQTQTTDSIARNERDGKHSRKTASPEAAVVANSNHHARRPEEGVLPKNPETVPPARAQLPTKRSEQLERFLGNLPHPDRRKHLTPSHPEEAVQLLSSSLDGSYLSPDLRRFPSFEAQAACDARDSKSHRLPQSAASHSSGSGQTDSLPRKVIGIGSDLFSPEDVLNWKLSLMDTDIRLSPGSDDYDSSGCSPTLPVESTVSGEQSEVTADFSFEETLEEALEDGLTPKGETEEDEDEENAVEEEENKYTAQGQRHPVKSSRGKPHSSFEVLDKQLDTLLSQTLDPSDPFHALMNTLELYAIQNSVASVKPRTAHAQHAVSTNADNRKQFLSLTAGVECIRDSKSPIKVPRTIGKWKSAADRVNATMGRIQRVGSQRKTSIEEEPKNADLNERKKVVLCDAQKEEQASMNRRNAVERNDVTGSKDHIMRHRNHSQSVWEELADGTEKHNASQRSSGRNAECLCSREFRNEDDFDSPSKFSSRTGIPQALRKTGAADSEPDRDQSSRKTIRSPDQQRHWMEKSEEFTGNSAALPRQSLPWEATASCPTGRRLKPTDSARGRATDRQVRNGRLESLEDGLTAPENSDSDIYLSWSVLGRAGQQGGSSPDMPGYLQSIYDGPNRTLGLYGDGRATTVLTDKNYGYPESDVNLSRGGWRVDHLGCSPPPPTPHPPPPPPSDINDADERDVDDDREGIGGFNGPSYRGRVRHPTFRTAEHGRGGWREADGSANGSKSKSRVDQRIDLLTYRPAPEVSPGRRRSAGLEEEASGNKIAFDEVSRRVSDAEDGEASLLLFHGQNADLASPSSSSPPAAATTDTAQERNATMTSQWLGSNQVSGRRNCVARETHEAADRGKGIRSGKTTHRPKLCLRDIGDHQTNQNPIQNNCCNACGKTCCRSYDAENGVIDLRHSVRNALDRMTERMLQCLHEDEEPCDRKDYSGSPLSMSSCAGSRVAKTCATGILTDTNSFRARLAKMKRLQEEFLEELVRLDGQRADRLNYLHRRVVNLEKLFTFIFGEGPTREGLVVKKFVISASAEKSEDWEIPRLQHPEEVDIIVLRDGINIEGLHVDGAYDSKPIRVQQQEIQRLFDSISQQMTSRPVETNSVDRGPRWPTAESDPDVARNFTTLHNRLLMQELSRDVDFLPPPPPEWST